MRIEGDLALTLSAQVSYIEQIGLSGKVLTKDVEDNTGTRKLRENNWRDVDLQQVIKSLDIAQNKFLLLRLLPRMEVFELLLMLDKEQLLYGLMYLPREQLLFLIMQLPKELLIRMLLYLMPLEDLIKMMPSRELFAILKNRRLETKDLIRAFKFMPEKYLQFILMKMTQKPLDKLQKGEMLAMFKQFRKRQIIDGMQMLPFKALQPLVHSLVEDDPELLLSVSTAFMYKMMDRVPKANLVDACRVLPDDLILDFLSQLPDQFLAMVAEQIDDSVFEQYLMSEQQNLLLYLGSGASPDSAL